MPMLKNCAGKTILLIEDDATLRAILETELVKEHACVLKAENGQQGLELALKERPDLIVLDLLMPILDGLGFLEKLREDDWGKSARVLILTNVERIKKVEEAIGLGVFDFLIKKDWPIDVLTEKIMLKLAGG